LPALNTRCKRTILEVVTDILQLVFTVSSMLLCSGYSQMHVILPLSDSSHSSELSRSQSTPSQHHYHYSHMVQGKTKGFQKKASTSRKTRHAAANTKKGQRTIAPKKSILIKQAALHKVHVHRASSSSPTSLSNQLCQIGSNCQN
jgi:hypothetical protein